MLVTFFKKPKNPKGARGAINYLLNYRVLKGTARCIAGDPALTRQIADSSPWKDKATVGCLSFEECNIDERLKYELMADFEKMLLPGLDKSQYNILWVEHVDKGRLELNFVIPKYELTTGKYLTPYYYRADQARKEAWETKWNLTQGWSSALDPAKQRNIEGLSRIKAHQNSYEELDLRLHQLVARGQIANRKELKKHIQDLGVEITRSPKNSLSLKLPGAKRATRFKGGIYSEEFTSREAIGEIHQALQARKETWDNRDTKSELQAVTERLERYTAQKAVINRKKYPSGERENIIDAEPPSSVISIYQHTKGVNHDRTGADAQRAREFRAKRDAEAKERRARLRRSVGVLETRSKEIEQIIDTTRAARARKWNENRSDYEKLFEIFGEFARDLRRDLKHVKELGQHRGDEQTYLNNRKKLHEIQDEFKQLAEKIREDMAAELTKLEAHTTDFNFTTEQMELVQELAKAEHLNKNKGGYENWIENIKNRMGENVYMAAQEFIKRKTEFRGGVMDIRTAAQDKLQELKHEQAERVERETDFEKIAKNLSKIKIHKPRVAVNDKQLTAAMHAKAVKPLRALVLTEDEVEKMYDIFETKLSPDEKKQVMARRNELIAAGAEATLPQTVAEYVVSKGYKTEEMKARQELCHKNQELEESGFELKM